MTGQTEDAAQGTGTAETHHRDAEEVTRAYVNLWNERDYARIPELVAESFVHVDPDGEELRGRDEMEAFMRAVVEGFSNFRVEVTEMLSDGELVMYRADLVMTHDGEFQGVPPTGQTFEIPEMATVRVDDGVVTEHRVYYDKGGVQARLAPTED